MTPWTTACQASLSFTLSWTLLKLKSIELVMPSNHLILCRLFSSCPQSFPASGSFPMRQFFPSGGQSIEASASVLPMNILDWFALVLTGWISLQARGSNTTVQKHQFFGVQPYLWSNMYGPYPFMSTRKTIALTKRAFIGKVMSLFFFFSFIFISWMLITLLCFLIWCLGWS